MGSSQLQPLLLDSTAAFAEEVHPDVAAELLVSDAVDERTEQAREHVVEQEAAVEDVDSVAGQSGQQDDVDEGGDEGQHADEELDPVQGDGVAGVPGRGPARTGGCLGREQDLHVGDDHSQEDEGEEKHLRGRRGGFNPPLVIETKPGNKRMAGRLTWETILRASWYGVLNMYNG